MKYISFCVPCYNSASYMRRCIESLLSGGDDVEIVIVDDGSTQDNTAEIADEYAAQYPSIVKAVHQPNGGHGAGVNCGLANATGLYYKVVDSDDWVNEDSLQKVLALIKKMVDDGTTVDMLMCNYVYEYADGSTPRVIDYVKTLPTNREFTFDEAKRFGTGKFIAMHTVLYRASLLKETGMKLPEHTFYVDNIFVYEPLPYVKSMYYLPEDLYRYYVGREDQSINEQVLMKRIDQHIRVANIVIDSHDLEKVKKTSKRLAKYMSDFVLIMVVICSIYLIKLGDKESLCKKRELWAYLKNKDKKLYRYCKRHFIGVTSTNTKIGMSFCKTIYKLARKTIKFN